MTTDTKRSPVFRDLGISEKLLAALEQNNFINPSPIQHQAIPAALDGKDLIGIAQTGTGKTLAFGIPMIQRIGKNGGQGLVLLPTRELAIQVDENLQKIGRALGLRTAVLIGGASMGLQKKDLHRNPHIIIATPGRLVDHLQQRTVSLQKVSVMVLDEADRMLDIGFLPQIKQVISSVPNDRQLMMFSATMPSEIAKLASQHMHLPLRIEVAPPGTSAKNIEQEVFMIGKEQKMQLLDKILAENPGTILVFARTKYGAKKIAAQVRHMGHSATEIHSNRSLAQRKDAMSGFKSGKYRILVATDIAARGIDVNDISLIVNFDLPSNSEDYVHRIGRTGRAGKSGKAISFASPGERGDIKSIERLIRKTLPIIALPVLPPRRTPPPRPNFSPQQQPYNSRSLDDRPQRARRHRGTGFHRRHR